MIPHHYFRYAALAIAAAIGFAGCSSVTDNPATTGTITITQKMLPQIDSNAVYQLWFSYPKTSAQSKNPHFDHGDASYVSVGRFTVAADGSLIGLDGKPAAFTFPSSLTPGLVADVILTVEPKVKTDTLPGARLISGTFTGTPSLGTATLVLSGDDAFGDAMGTIGTGYAVLETPTTTADADFASGIWFVKPDGTTMAPGLTLPVLPISDENPLWHYEAWVVTGSGSSQQYTKLGSFLDPAQADSDGAGPQAGPNTSSAFAYPGQDLITGSTSVALNDGAHGVAVSLEPDGIVTNRPTAVLLSAGTIPAATARLQAFPLPANAGLPTMSISFTR
ncbi:MAG TPA: hypothetical protein VHI13_11540 [Candidatus Kapabacteria bacterium]|nr:hypothetical protein [Candidatus Kapabacteria bacterium]